MTWRWRRHMEAVSDMAERRVNHIGIMNFAPPTTCWTQSLNYCAVYPTIGPMGARVSHDKKNRENVETVARQWWYSYSLAVSSGIRRRETGMVPPPRPCPRMYL